MNKPVSNNIPISVSLKSTLDVEHIRQRDSGTKSRLLFISLMAVILAIAVNLIAKFLLILIHFITNLSFFGKLSIADVSPASNSLGLYVILIPAIGGIAVGLMAFFGSKAIRGHGIPEAMEQILTNQSKIKPTVTYLKPVSSAISIGTGGPFGAEGPIIATGGALGSTFGQILKISHHERKILLAAGATAGMSAIFNSPVAAIFLAIELLLFEFSPRSIIPVTLACITGAAGHRFFFGEAPVFEMSGITITGSGNVALLIYSGMGVIIGLLSVGITKLVYLVEDTFEKLPIHWMWWPMIGGIAVGIVGFLEPRTLGVGYNNITDVLSGNLPFQVVVSLGALKFVSWAISLGSGTSGGTLAPLLTIGGAAGLVLGSVILDIFPGSGISVPLAAMVGMAATFTGASRAFITSIIFALETTGQYHAFLPLLATCTASYLVSFFAMENTIMTEKIARRGVKAPDSYHPDMLEKISVEQVMDEGGTILSSDNNVEEVIEWLENEPENKRNYFVVANNNGEYMGIVSSSRLYSRANIPGTRVENLIKQKPASIEKNNSLKSAIEVMATENVDVLPVISDDAKQIVGILSYQNILSGYKLNIEEHQSHNPEISLRRKGLKLVVHGQKITRFFIPGKK
ncbi:MAG: chloride channel protein [Bacteroidia bacterium]|nr:chloride channel protein [Bacteroidia bacterium]